MLAVLISDLGSGSVVSYIFRNSMYGAHALLDDMPKCLDNIIEK